MSKREGSGVRLAIVVSEFNYDVTYLMLQRAISHAEFLGAEVAYVVKAPGAYDIPFFVKEVLEKPDVDAVAAIGAIITGATKHDELIAHQLARKLVDLSLEYGKPVALGVSGPGMNRMQALERVDEYAKRAVEAAIKMAVRIKKLKQASYSGETVVVE